jgi:hypothetical protein
METSTRTRFSIGKQTAIGIGIVTFVVLALAVFLTMTNRRKPMNTIATESTPAAMAGIPPIDTETPVRTETATFALG